jgi:putative hydrolase of the HAD superfamily
LDFRTPKAILFDLDDTILAFDMVSEECWQSVCNGFAPRIRCDAETLYAAVDGMRRWYQNDEERHRYMRLNLEKARREVVSLAFERLGVDAPILANEMADTYSAKRVEAIYVLPGAINALTRVKDDGLRLALITNGQAVGQRRKLEKFSLSSLFDCVLIEGEFGVGKPDERVFRHTLEKLGVVADEAWMVGDDLERDIGGAQAVGISGIWVDWKGKGLPSSSKIRPERIIKSIAELF